LEILFFSSEVAPWSKTGGLADVAGSLPQSLAARGHAVTVVSPLYGGPGQAEGLKAVPVRVPVALGDDTFEAELFEAPLGAARVLFIYHPALFQRRELYGAAGHDFPDNATRFAFLCQAGLQAARALGLKPDVVHANDWQTGPAVLGVALDREPRRRFAEERVGPATVFTIHNLAYQGLFPPEVLAQLGWPPWLLDPGRRQQVEFYHQVSFLKAGLAFADAITTVSPTYAEEICTPEQGAGLDGLLLERRVDLHGILNGIDPKIWDPSSDPHLPAWYGAKKLEGKAICKARLQAELGLKVDAEIPLFVAVTRLVDQKGFDLLVPCLDKKFLGRAQVALLGTGDTVLEQALNDRQRAFPGSLAVRLGFDEPLAHRLQAGGDFLLMPSRYEPCGLAQMYALRYGTVPVVHATGGLADTVADASANLSRGTGLTFAAPTVAALREALERALRAFRHKGLTALRRRGMSQDFSWDSSATKYLALYRSLMQRPPSVVE
jgi:starch synthase